MKKYTRIFLCGLMGSGKSTVGRILASRLEVPFSDLDSMIEQKTGTSIAAIFESDGESRFREIERAVLEEVLDGDRDRDGDGDRDMDMDRDGLKGFVMALGGGALQSRELAAKVAGAGILIYLETSVEELVVRLQGDQARPLLAMPDEPGVESHQPEPKKDTEPKTKASVTVTSIDPENRMKETLQRLLHDREPLYRMAALQVNTDGKSPEEVADVCFDICLKELAVMKRVNGANGGDL
ncbi:MAG: hypothetical protein DA443_00665 [Bacteroidetes bacterium]|nr:MAG: hypothetical protein DA443_00665 [Bacteroidota bacterium]